MSLEEAWIRLRLEEIRLLKQAYKGMLDKGTDAKHRLQDLEAEELLLRMDLKQIEGRTALCQV